ncbi:MAG TPA: hypothetical protein VFJ58_10565 [Armatimonadota bacterium]|nr:hypothetical protein [Armatimonadota bacterium]
MSVLSSFRAFIDSCARKKNARSYRVEPVQITSPAGTARTTPAKNLQVWTTNITPAGPASSVAPKAASSATALLEPPPFLQDAAPIRYMADIPGDLRERIQQDGMARSLRRLETPLRALHMATSRKGSGYPAEELRGFLLMWRQALADYVGLVADERSVIVYERSVDEAYFVRGRCEVGAHLTILEPCWKLNGEVVVRGEAQVVQGWVR